MKPNQVNCKNCERPFDADFQFCPHCGQKANDELTIGVLFYNTISNYFSFDARFFKSFIPLLFKPGYLAKEFIKGKRLLYLHPAQMYLFVSVVFFFIFSFTVSEQSDSLTRGFKEALDSENIALIDPLLQRTKDSLDRIEIRETLENTKLLSGMSQREIDSIVSLDVLPKKNNISLGSFQVELDSLLEAQASDKVIYEHWDVKEGDNWFKRKVYEQGLKLYKAKDAGNIWATFIDTVPIALFFLLPIFAFIIKFFYYKKGSYSHHLVFGFYYFSFIFTVLSIIFGINMIFELSDIVDFLIALSCFIYLFIAIKRFYNQGWFLSFIKTSLLTMLFFPVVFISAVLIMFFAFMFY
ncbi:DUF3667 domain-containing protein [Winogradskyella costae]|uniref:DUF3667 domain-containing protein n=1 Tax=Winogradskyella costae TaxID=2697008 RepID=UPI0015CA5B87|nr:DUF3667 domain-containing protein [Winogradskyella costae]